MQKRGEEERKNPGSIPRECSSASLTDHVECSPIPGQCDVNEVTSQDADDRNYALLRYSRPAESAMKIPAEFRRVEKPAGAPTHAVLDEPCNDKGTGINTRIQPTTGHKTVEEPIHLYECCYKCCWESCNFSTSDRKVFMAHLQIHMKSKPYNCPGKECTFTTYAKRQLVSHILLHAIVPPFRCSALACTYTCYRSSDMLKHAETTHRKKRNDSDQMNSNFTPASSDATRTRGRKSTVDQTYCCPWPDCHFQCWQKIDMRPHLQHIHSWRFPQEEDYRNRQCHCSRCQKKYMHRAAWQPASVGGPDEHIQLRSGELSFIKKVTLPKSSFLVDPEHSPVPSETSGLKPEKEFGRNFRAEDSISLKRMCPASSTQEKAKLKGKIPDE